MSSPLSVARGNADLRMSVPLLDLKEQYRTLREEMLAAITDVCETQAFILGPRTRQLEDQLAKYCGAAHGIGVSSGTDALLLALMALGCGSGDEIITSPYTFFATGGTIARVGARPVFVDIEPATFNLSVGAVQRFLDASCDIVQGRLVNRATGARVRGIMPVHLYGQCADMPALMAISRRFDLPVIEDAAQAIGSEIAGGQRAGSFGHVGCFSFFPSKNLGAFGDAGLCTAQDAELAEVLRVMRVHGGKPKYYHAVIGGNFRIDELQSAVLCVKLRYLDGWTAARQRNAALYDRLFAAAGLGNAVATPVVLPGYRHIYNQYVIRAQERDRLRKHLADAGVGTEIYYPVPLHRQRCFEYLGIDAGTCPESDQAAAESLALPVFPELTQEQIEYVVAGISRFYS
jgi:dTDP-4-amino-4,6-dideoxygalactose transaminase